jgi:hypothetical protein
MDINEVRLHHHCRPLLTALVFFLLSGCGYFGRTYEVSVRTPNLNTPNFPDHPADTSESESRRRFWDVSWINMDGTVSERRIEDGQTVVLNLPKEQPAVVCAVPVIPGVSPPFGYRPAGGLRPAEMPALPELQLSWEEGFSSNFMLELARSGVAPDRINIRRFQDAVARRGGGNPWTLDLRRLASDFISGDLWIYSFVIPPKYPVVVPLSPGCWYSEYPPDLPLFSAAGSWSGELPEGLHRFLKVPGGTCVSVSVNDRGEMNLIREY